MAGFTVTIRFVLTEPEYNMSTVYIALVWFAALAQTVGVSDTASYDKLVRATFGIPQDVRGIV